MFPVILEEIQRTSCQPREVCVEVAKEYPEPTSQFYLPRCVALHRCGGCCTNEAFYCTNTSHTLINKTVSGAAGFIYPVFLHVTHFLALHYTTVLVFSPLTPQTAPENRTQKKTSSQLCNTLIGITTRPILQRALWLQLDIKSTFTH